MSTYKWIYVYCISNRHLYIRIRVVNSQYAAYFTEGNGVPAFNKHYEKYSKYFVGYAYTQSLRSHFHTREKINFIQFSIHCTLLTQTPGIHLRVLCKTMDYRKYNKMKMAKIKNSSTGNWNGNSMNNEETRR